MIGAEMLLELPSPGDGTDYHAPCSLVRYAGSEDLRWDPPGREIREIEIGRMGQLGCAGVKSLLRRNFQRQNIEGVGDIW